MKLRYDIKEALRPHDLRPTHVTVRAWEGDRLAAEIIVGRSLEGLFERDARGVCRLRVGMDGYRLPRSAIAIQRRLRELALQGETCGT